MAKTGKHCHLPQTSHDLLQQVAQRSISFSVVWPDITLEDTDQRVRNVFFPRRLACRSQLQFLPDAKMVEVESDNGFASDTDGTSIASSLGTPCGWDACHRGMAANSEYRIRSPLLREALVQSRPASSRYC